MGSLTNLSDNIILKTDSYKMSHRAQYPSNTSRVYSYFESRTGARYQNTIFFGLQYLLKKHLEGIVITRDHIAQAEGFFSVHMAGSSAVFNKAGWEHILNVHNGMLPVRIKAVPEGTAVPVSNVLMTVENTDPACYWLTNYLETLLVQVWYPCVVATISNAVRKTIRLGLIDTGDTAGLDYKLHDFGFRGVSSLESAEIGGLAHLVNFNGTDTIPAISAGIQYYDSGVCAHSIPASEHSTITSWGKNRELDAYANMLEQYPTGLVACVSDSYDIFNACENLWGTELKEKIISRKGTLVIRPDSGPIVPTLLKVLSILWDKFGGTINSKFYKVLDSHIRVIQGDGCTPETITEIIECLKLHHWSIDNIAFGMGGGLLQKLDRDTQKFAFKCSSITNASGASIDVYKSPIGDSTKASKRGRLKLIREQGSFKTVSESHPGDDLLETVFENGELVKNYTFDEIRKRARNPW